MSESRQLAEKIVEEIVHRLRAEGAVRGFVPEETLVRATQDAIDGVSIQALDPLDRAIGRATKLGTDLEEIYQAREAGRAFEPEKMRALELMIEEAASNAAFADTDGFRKGYRL